MRRCILVTIFSLVVPLAAAASSAGLSGTLEGKVTASDGGAPFEVKATLDGQTGKVKYPECRGSLTFIRSQDMSYWFKERITHGKKNCFDGGVVEISPSSSASLWNWEWKGNGVTATGVLSGSLAPGRQ